MNSYSNAHRALVVLLLFCMYALSCKPPGKHSAPEKTNSHSAEQEGKEGKGLLSENATTDNPKQKEMGEKTVLSKEQIVQIANGAARRHGYDPKEMVYDEGNVAWKKEPRGPWPELEGHDFQAVEYWHRSLYTAGGGIWVLVDRNTGEVLRVVGSP